MTVVDLFTVQILSDEDGLTYPGGLFPPLMAEMEENLTLLLPKGYRARIRRWDHPDEEGDEQWETAPTMPSDEQTTNERNPG